MKAIARVAGTLGLLASLSACTTLQGKVADGTYTSPDGEFSVMVPRILDVETTDGVVGSSKRFVDFSMGPYWTAEGAYSVEWYKLDKPYADPAAFIAETRKFLPVLVKKSLGDSFAAVLTQDTQVDGHPAVCVVADGEQGSTPAYWVATSIDFGDRVGIALLLVAKPSEHQSGPAEPADAPNWGFYQAFTKSLIRH